MASRLRVKDSFDYTQVRRFYREKIILATVVSALLILPVVSFAQTSKAASPTEVNTVRKVDLKRYSGKWYEIARYPNKFQKNCIGNTTANLCN